VLPQRLGAYPRGQVLPAGVSCPRQVLGDSQGVYVRLVLGFIAVGFWTLLPVRPFVLHTKAKSVFTLGWR
jgi:hypothetical protein